VRAQKPAGQRRIDRESSTPAENSTVNRTRSKLFQAARPTRFSGIPADMSVDRAGGREAF
jgi:hypothetical protein